MNTTAILCALLCLAGCSPTSATVGRTVTVLLVTSGADAASSEARRALQNHLAQQDHLEPASLARLASLAADDREESTEEAEIEAQRRLEQAEVAFSNFEYSGATAQLGEALELLRPLARRATGRARLAQIHMQLAMVLHVHGERDAALEEIRTCIHLDPRCAPDPARHPPELIELHRAVTEADAQAASLRIVTDPPGATASIDGRREARTPVDWSDVAPGRHYVTLARDGFLPEVQLVSVTAGAPTERHFALSPGPPPMRASAALRALRESGPDAEPRWRAEAANLSEADVLLVLRVQNHSLVLAAFDGRGNVISDAISHDSDDGDAVRRYVDRVLPSPTVPWFGQWWFWTPVAVVAALALATATFLAVFERNIRLVGGPVVVE